MENYLNKKNHSPRFQPWGHNDDQNLYWNTFCNTFTEVETSDYILKLGMENYLNKKKS